MIKISYDEGMSRKLDRFAFISFKIPDAMALRWVCSASPLFMSV